jgi:DNA mismatch repair ATPase MutS
MFMGAVLNVFFLWDIRIIYMITQWQDLNQHTITKVFDLIGKMEALSSLSTWSFNHDHFAYPTFSEDTFELSTQDMGHPLLDMNVNVHNDFQSTVQDHITIITGSNMSGKSTFLRTIGTNMVLAYAGTRVHARQLECSVVQIISYMRIKDALEESVSTFKAELNRIQMILEELANNKNCLILIDEMLRGTNSRDKLKGSIGITKKLMSMEAYVMIATHDIKLAEMGRKHTEQIKNYFFDIDFQDGDLKFDYKIKPGICENFNASFLIGQLGIDMES